VLDTTDIRSKELINSNAFVDTPLANISTDSDALKKRKN